MKRIQLINVALIALLALPVSALADDHRERLSWGSQDQRSAHDRGHNNHLYERGYGRGYDRRDQARASSGFKVIIGSGIAAIGYQGHHWNRGPSYLKDRREHHYGHQYNSWRKHQQQRRFSSGFAWYPDSKNHGGNHPSKHHFRNH